MWSKDQRVLTNRLCRRRTILHAVLGGASLIAGGRVSPSRAGAARLNPEGGEPAADAAEEQVLQLQSGGIGASRFHFNPLTGGGDSPEEWQSLLHLPPLYVDVDLNLRPAIFDSWQPNEDFTVWTFTLDPRATWSDGSRITAADVKGTWELMTTPILENSRIGGYLGNVKGFDQVLVQSETEAPGLVVKDEGTLEVQLRVTDPLFNWRIATVHLVPTKIEQARQDPENFWQPTNDPVSSGPFVLEQFEPDQGTASLGKNPNWWLGEGPYLNRIEFRYVTDPGTVALMVQNNEVDATQQPLPMELREQFPDFFRPVKSFSVNAFWLIPTVEPTDDVNVRRALILSVDFADVFKAAFPLGGGTVATQLLDPDLPCIDGANTWYPYDPEAARVALAGSKYGSAENLPKLRVTPRGVGPVRNRALEAVVEFWRQNLGITNVEFQQDPEAFGPDAERLNLSRDDIAIRYPDSAFYLWSGIHSEGPMASETMKGYTNPKVDQLIVQALTAPIDDLQRCELALEAQRVFMEDYQVLFFGIEETTLNARSYVRNVAKNPDRALIKPWNIYIAEH